MARLVVASGPDAGKEYELGDRETVGRSEPASIVIVDTKISRQHARLVRRGDEYFIADLNSSNGTFINGQKATRHKLNDGDRITFGTVEVTFEGLAAEPDEIEIDFEDEDPDIDWGDDDEIERLNRQEAVRTGSYSEGIQPRVKAPVKPQPAAASGVAVRHNDKTLQYSKYAQAGGGGGLLSEDVAQRGFLGKLIVYGIVALVASGLFFVVWKMTQAMFAGEE
ncbi:MAG: FHA domain-containing protein [Planctomycetota bacterium]